ncbi:protein of unknown function [Burkholderia multivorans]
MARAFAALLHRSETCVLGAALTQ